LAGTILIPSRKGDTSSSAPITYIIRSHPQALLYLTSEHVFDTMFGTEAYCE